jgi:lipopolysaccharide transport system permease protein
VLVETSSETGMASPPPLKEPGGAATHVELPAEPIFTIDEERKWIGFEFRDLWAHRDLFYFLAWRDVKVRYKQTVLGAFWAILQPFLTMVVSTLLFRKLAHVPSEGEPYAIFSHAGLLPRNFFSSTVTNSSNSLVGNANLITKVYFPRLVIPGAAVGAALVDFAIASLILLLMMPWYGVPFGHHLLMLPPLVVLTTLVSLPGSGCGLRR